MILYPLDLSGRPSSEENSTIPVWQAIERRQKQECLAWWLIAQPDHAGLAGNLASHLAHDSFPRLVPEVIRAITLHDEGWVEFDLQPICETSRQGRIGRPLSFLEMKPPDFLQAWRASIERAQQDSPIGGILVSKHFCRIAQTGTTSSHPRTEDHEMVSEFLVQETARQTRLFHQQHRTIEEIELLTDGLQFLDLLSLYLCCGSRKNVSFPQHFSGRSICIFHEDEAFRTEPRLFGQGVSLGITARPYPATAGNSPISIPVLIT
jgi:Protein of unknown function (DUF3891)